MRRLAIACLWLLVVAVAHAGPWSGNCIQPISFGQTVGNQLTPADCYWYYSATPDEHHSTDVYTFNGAAGQQISVAMASAGFDTYVEVYNVNDVNATPLVTDDNGGGGTNSRIPSGAGYYTLPASGTYYIWAQSAAPNATGAYALTLNGIATEYSRNYVQKAYVGYYGRPGDPPGEDYWSNRMDSEGQSLTAIIVAFGNSAEFVRRYGNLDNAALVTKIYQQLLARNPDQAGRDYYVGELAAGRKTLQTITLDVLNGATTPPDSIIVANKLDVAAYFTAKVAAGCFYGSEQDGVDMLAAVTSDPATVAAAKAAIDTRCAGSAVMQDSYPLNQLYFELPNLLGKTVWAMGYYGNPQVNGDGVGFLVDNPLRLEVDEEFPPESFARLDGNLPPDDWQGDEVLVRGVVKDYAKTYGVSAMHPTPLITIVEYHRLHVSTPTNSWENSFLTVSPAPPVAVTTPARPKAAATRPQPKAVAAGNHAQDCDRSIIISGGVDASNNHARYVDNIVAKYNKMKELGFTDAQIRVFYDDGAAINQNGTSITPAKATKQKIKDGFSAVAGEMSPSCTLTIFVTDHGTGFNAAQGYKGARPALSGADATSGVLYPENTFKIDARALAFRVSSSFVLHGNSYFVTKRSDNIIRLYKRVDGNWTFIGKDDNNDGTISETEAGGEDFNGNGVVDADSGLAVTELQNRLVAYKYNSQQWDTDGDGTPDVRVRHDGTRFVVERLDGGTWKEMGRDTDGDFIIDANDGGVDWNLDGNKNGQVGFHEGINLWGSEVLWDDEFADILKPLSDSGIHIVVEMVSCFSGGIVPQLQWLVESVYAGAAEDDKHYNRVDASNKIYAADEMAFLGNLQGIDPESWTAAGFAAGVFDDAVATAANKTKNGHVLWQTPYYESQSVYKAEGNNEYTVQLNVPADLTGKVYDFELILGLQKPRWLFVEFLQNLPAGLDSEAIPGGFRVFSNQPIPDQLVFGIAVSGATVTDAIRIEYTDVNHHRLGYTKAVPGTPEPPPYIMFGQPLVCITHGNPNFPSTLSTIEWLFPLDITGPVIPSTTQVTLRITGPGMTHHDFPTTLESALALYFLYGINSVGQYGFQILSAQNTQTMQPVPFGGYTFGTVNVTFPAQQNVGLCAPPP